MEFSSIGNVTFHGWSGEEAPAYIKHGFRLMKIEFNLSCYGRVADSRLLFAATTTLATISIIQERAFSEL